MGAVEDLYLDDLAGLSFCDAFDRVVMRNPNVRKVLNELKETSRLSDFHPTIEFAHSLKFHEPWSVMLDRQAELAVLFEPGGRFSDAIYQDYHEAIADAVWMIFTEFLALVQLFTGGYLVAIGVRPDGEAEVMPLEGWWCPDAQIDIATSAFTGRLHLRDDDWWQLDYPHIGLHRPRVSATDMDGLSLSDAFLKFVLRDAGVKALGARVEDHSKIDPEKVRFGRFWGGLARDKYWWPIEIHRIVTMPDGDRSNEGQFMSAIGDRMSQLLRPLLSGEVEAKGYNQIDNVVLIQRSVWTDDCSYIHAHDHSIGHWADDAGALAPGGPQVRFRNVELRAIEANQEKQSAPPSEFLFVKPLTPDQQCVMDAVQKLWSGEVPPNLRPSEIINQIMDHIDRNGWRPVGEKTIERAIFRNRLTFVVERYWPGGVPSDISSEVRDDKITKYFKDQGWSGATAKQINESFEKSK
ncbi:MAG: hypothetical protein GY789_21285 [Hyphomicrobiales bacterium]|nr:hypothetical protein [Hyphomicrobiales bacterium]